MKLAEALSERAAMRADIDAMTARAKANARYQEGEEPPENAQELLQAILVKVSEKSRLIARINLTNTQITLADGTLMTQALANRDALREALKIMDTVATAAGPSERGYMFGRSTKSELKDISAVRVTEVRARQAEAAEELRKLDNAIQQAGWTYDLAE